MSQVHYLVKKGKLLTFVCYKVNFSFCTEWHLVGSLWCYYSHNASICMWNHLPSDFERFINMGNGNKVAIEAIGIFWLFLKTYFHLDLVEIYVTSYVWWNLISIYILVKSDSSCSFGNKVSLSYDSNVVGYRSLIDIECSYYK